MCDAASDPFDALGLPPQFRLGAQELRRAWMRRLAQVHPDAVGTSEKGTCANDAFRVLSDPITRAQALLRRLKAPDGDERAMPEGFLAEMMDLRERADAAAGDPDALDALRSEAVASRERAIERIAVNFDAAGGSTRTRCPPERFGST